LYKFFTSFYDSKLDVTCIWPKELVGAGSEFEFRVVLFKQLLEYQLLW